MRKLLSLTALTAAALTLAACGSADDASSEASADTVEMPADSALAPVTDAPVADPSATATDA
ncbi:MAG: ABC transporter substrate-binding protein, partial [Erythrobacter sp.]|nr:ABC transporter substrate-binding protein [Erythrobacter sp.]